MLFSPSIGLMRRKSGLVPVDGPAGVYVPSTAAHFTALSINPPSSAYACDEESGNLSPSIGAGDLVKGGTAAHLYKQSVPGWTASFVGAPGGSALHWKKANPLAVGESCFVLVYISHESPSNPSLFLVSGSQNRMLSQSSGKILSLHNSSGVIGNEIHAGIDTVHPILWARNAVTNQSGCFTDLEQFAVPHNESSFPGDVSIGSDQGGDTPLMRVCRFFIWRGADANALISAGLANKTLLTSLGWPLSY